MQPTNRFEFILTPEIQSEAMMAVTKAVSKGRNIFLSIIVCGTNTVLTGIGGVGLVLILTRWGNLNPEPWARLVGWIFGSCFYLLGSQLLYKSTVKTISERSFKKISRYIVFEETGMIYGAGRAVWSTPWGLIDSVIETKRTVTIIIAGAGFCLPKSAIGDATMVAHLMEYITTKIKDARLA